MDIKWKNWIKSWYMKAVAYLIIAMCAFTVITLVGSIKTGSPEDWISVLNKQEFSENYSFYHDLDMYAHSFADTKMKYESKDKIIAGEYAGELVKQYTNSIYQRWIAEGINFRVNVTHAPNSSNLRFHWIGTDGEKWSEEVSGDSFGYEEYSYGYNDYGYQESTSEYQYGDMEEVATTEVPDSQRKTQEALPTMEEFLALHPQLEEDLRKGVIESQVYTYNENERQLNRFVDYESKLYESKEEVAKWDFGFEPLALSVRDEEGNEVAWYDGKELRDMHEKQQIEQNVLGAENYLVVGLSKAIYDQKTAEWNALYEQLSAIGTKVVLAVVLALFAGFFLLAVTGHEKNEIGLVRYPFDKIYLELQLPAIGLGIFAMCALGFYVIERNRISDGNILVQLSYYGFAALAVIVTGIFMSIVRNIKAKQFIHSSIILRVIRKIGRVLHTIWSHGSIVKRAFLLAIVLPLVAATWIGTPFVIAFLIYYIYKHLGSFVNICNGARKIRNGELDYKIQVQEEKGVLYNLANDINEISEGLDNAIENELRSQRLKTELISNVSHDIKTPLTSIIGYVDLLQKEEFENDTIKEYVEVIAQKADRLSVLTNDLFEAAKASSGDMPVQLEAINLCSIINQALGEYEDKLLQAQLEIKTNFPTEPAIALVDGRLVWRVFSNLLSNVVKYAQPNSRVYIDVRENSQQGVYVFTIKNISAYELNVEPNELLERFTRGDASRHTQGSGLGLSIANSLVRLQGGTFDLMIDGDLFKAIIRFKKTAIQKNNKEN